MAKARYLVEAHLLEGRSVSELAAAAHGVHRSWIYKLLARYRNGGYEALELNRQTSDRHAAAFAHFMARFDRHDKVFEQHEKAFAQHERAMEQHGKAMQSHEQAFAKHEEVMGRVTAALDRHEARADEFKIFIREQNRRSEKIIQEMLRRNEAFNAEQSRRTDEIVSGLRDQRAESKAQTEALLRLIDRFPPPAEAA